MLPLLPLHQIPSQAPSTLNYNNSSPLYPQMQRQFRYPNASSVDHGASNANRLSQPAIYGTVNQSHLGYDGNSLGQQHNLSYAQKMNQGSLSSRNHRNMETDYNNSPKYYPPNNDNSDHFGQPSYHTRPIPIPKLVDHPQYLTKYSPTKRIFTMADENFLNVSQQQDSFGATHFKNKVATPQPTPRLNKAKNLPTYYSQTPYGQSPNQMALRLSAFRPEPESEVFNEDDDDLLYMFDAQQNALHMISRNISDQAQQKKQSDTRELQERLRMLEMENLMREQENHFQKMLKLKEAREQERMERMKEKKKNKPKPKDFMTNVLEKFIVTKLLRNMDSRAINEEANEESLVNLRKKNRSRKDRYDRDEDEDRYDRDEDEEDYDEDENTRGNSRKVTNIGRRRNALTDTANVDKIIRAQERKEQKEQQLKEEQEKLRLEEEAKAQIAKKEKLRRAVKCRLWSWMIPFLWQTRLKKEVTDGKAALDVGVNEQIGGISESMEKLYGNLLAGPLNELYQEKNLCIINGLEKGVFGSKNLSTKEIDDRAALIQARLRKIIGTMITATNVRNFQPHQLKFFTSMSRNQGVLPKNFMFDFEIKRLNFTDHGTLKNMNEMKTKMILGFFIFMRIFLFKLIFRPWEGNPSLKANNLQFVLNQRIIGSIIYYVLIDFYKKNIPPLPNNQESLPPELKTKAADPLKVSDETRDENQIVSQPSKKPEDGKKPGDGKKPEDDGILKGIFSREELSSYLNDRKPAVDELRGLIEGWHTSIYNLVQEYAQPTKKPKKA